MMSSETCMPHSTIRHRPIFTMPQVAPLVLRASQFQAPLSFAQVVPTGEEREAGNTHWHLFFCLGMAITFALLLFGHLVG